MFPLVVVGLAILFLVATYLGLIDEFAAVMRKLWGEPTDRGQTLLSYSRGEESERDDSDRTLQPRDLENNSIHDADEEVQR